MQLFPDGNLVVDQNDNLFGTAPYGGYGAAENGLVFMMSKDGKGWHETILHSFNDNDGINPDNTLVMDAAGNLYGTTTGGGVSYQQGVVFKLSPPAGGDKVRGRWKFSLLYQFTGGADGGGPTNLALDAAGNVIGVAASGGASGNGVVYQLSPTLSGPWTQTVLWNFAGGTDGSGPVGSIVVNGSNIFGATGEGGDSNNDGTVFGISRWYGRGRLPPALNPRSGPLARSRWQSRNK
ncbi:MAG: choice-of-anchor tandem repeat GloVer-containing protein [Rhodospirillales bacterium]